MTDVFISYAREDEAFAHALEDVFEADRLAVWWDRSSIQPGDEFELKIEEALETAGSAIVIWSAESKASKWVRAEARLAQAREILVPVVIDESIVRGELRLPLMFTGQHYVDLSGWDGRSECSQIEDLVSRVRVLLDSRPRGNRHEGTSPAIDAPSDLPLVRLGATGPYVQAAQQLLTLVGFGVEVDATFGRHSRTATTLFQSSNHLAADGTIGPDTWSALVRQSWYRAAAAPQLALGSKGASVGSLQQQLVALGYVVDVDEIFGPETLAAVEGVQRRADLDSDGVVGPDTRLGLIVELGSRAKPAAVRNS